MCYLDLAVANLINRGDVYGVDQYALRQVLPKLSREIWRLIGEGVTPVALEANVRATTTPDAFPAPALNPNTALAIMAIIGRGATP